MPYSQPADNSSDDRRFAIRINVQIHADLITARNSDVPVMMTNLSVSGCRFETDRILRIPSTVAVHIDGIEPIPGTAIWQRGPEVGCQFDDPIQVGLCNRIIRKIRASSTLPHR
ncbi:MAG: PilZ domain-containing protein [Blastomonas sp.]